MQQTLVSFPCTAGLLSRHPPTEGKYDGRPMPQETPSYVIEQTAEVLRLAFAGDISLKVTPQLKKDVEAALAGATFALVEVDLSKTSFMDSTGISVLVILHKRSRERGAGMRLVRPSTQVRRILDLVQLSQYFEIVE